MNILRLQKPSLLKSINISRRSIFNFTTNMPRIPLDKPFPIPDSASKNKIKSKNNEFSMSKLSNGITVVSKDSYSPIASVSLLVKAGSRYETAEMHGQGLLAEKLAFKSSESTTSFSIAQQLEILGAKFDCESNRDYIVYNVDFLRQFTPTIIDIMADTILSPAFHTYEIQNAKFNVFNQLKAINSEAKTEDELFSAAFRKSGLGLSRHPSAKIFDKMNSSTLREFHRNLFKPDRIILSAVGVDHDEFIISAEEFFGDYQVDSTSKTTENIVNLAGNSEYKGGEIREYDEDNTKESFVSIAFKSPGWKSKDVGALCVLAMLLGGGNSFSVGGPGKGMHSRLYQNVICGGGNYSSCSTFGSIHSDCGLFGITGSSDFSSAPRLFNAIVEELSKLKISGDSISSTKSKTAKTISKSGYSDEEVARAKNMALSTFLMNLESNRVLAEDKAKQIAEYGRMVSDAEFKEMIESVTKGDLVRVAENMFKSKPSVSLKGNTIDMPEYSQIEKKIQL